MKTFIVTLFLFANSLAYSSLEEDTTALERFLAAKPPYSLETGKDAYLALCEIRRQRGFLRLGFGLGSARLWEEKLLSVSKEGDVDKALSEANYPDTKIYDLIYLGRGWTKDFKSTDKDAVTANVFRALTAKQNKENKSR